MRHFKWQAEIAVPNAAVNGYMRHCAGIDISVWEQVEDGPSSYHWASPHLESLEVVRHVEDRASALLALWHGAMIAGYGPDFPSVSPGALSGSGGRTAHFSGDWRVSPFDGAVLRAPLRKSQADMLSGSLVDSAIFLARNDEALQHRLQSLGRHGPTGAELYKLCEFMKAQLGWGPDAVDREGQAPSGGFTERFRGTINNPALTSIDGRHGGAGNTKPMKRSPVFAEDAAPVIVLAFAQAIIELGKRRSAEVSDL